MTCLALSTARVATQPLFRVESNETCNVSIIKCSSEIFIFSKHGTCTTTCYVNRTEQRKLLKQQTWMTKSLPRKSAMERGSLFRPHTNRRKRDRSSGENSSRTSQNHLVRSSEGDTPLSVVTDLRSAIEKSGLPQT